MSVQIPSSTFRLMGTELVNFLSTYQKPYEMQKRKGKKMMQEYLNAVKYMKKSQRRNRTKERKFMERKKYTKYSELFLIISVITKA